MSIDDMFKMHMKHDEIFQQRIEGHLERIDHKLDALLVDVTGLKTKAVIWGSLGGLVLGGLLPWAISLLA
jgi:hypothetical protein